MESNDREEDEDEAVVEGEAMETVAQRRRQQPISEEAIVGFAIGFVGGIRVTTQWSLPSSSTVKVQTTLRTQLMMTLNPTNCTADSSIFEIASQ